MYKIVEKKVLNPTVIQLWIEAPLVANKAKPGQYKLYLQQEKTDLPFQEQIKTVHINEIMNTKG